MAGRMRPTFIVECYDERDAGEDDVGAVVELKDIVIVPCDSTAVLICPKRVNDGADSSLCKGVGAALGLNADRPSRKSCGMLLGYIPCVGKIGRNAVSGDLQWFQNWSVCWELRWILSTF